MLSLVTVFQAGGREALHQVAEPLAPEQIADRKTQRLINQMRKLMRSAHGVGLAAPQVGHRIRLAVIDRQADRSLSQDLVLINPVVSEASREVVDFEEGCLSIPEVFGQVTRPAHVRLTALDADGQSYSLIADGLLARVIQHEVDHLDGTLFIDRTDRLTKGRELLA